MIFVTEDFSANKQVKLDDPHSAGADAVKVLKLNATRNFNTGIYPYSTMTSVFTPVYQDEIGNTIKLTTTSQEWCGHTFLQANFRNTHYEIQSRSYFETEGDQDTEVLVTWLEDELWTQLRLDPSTLPTGEFDMVPGSIYCRFRHEAFNPVKAQGNTANLNDSLSSYKVSYPSLERSLKIVFETSFPHKIISWEESYPERGSMMTTKATLNKTMLLDYWNKNTIADAELRKALGLDSSHPGQEDANN